MFERYSEGARRVIYFARLEALHRDETSISVEDVLLGLTWDGHTRAGRIAALKTLATDIRAALHIPLLPSTALPYMREKDIPLENDAKKVLAYAADEANREREFWIDTDHLLRGIMRFKNDANSLLEGFGVTLKSLRLAAAQDRREHPSGPDPKWGKAKVVFAHYRTGISLLALAAILVALVVMLRLLGPVT